MSHLLEVSQLHTYFPARAGGGQIRACDGIDLVINAGEIVGLVGESGCGKSTLGRSIVGLERINRGTVRLNGVDLAGLRGADARSTRRKVQYIFQDSFAALSPRQKAGKAVEEAMTICGERDPEIRRRRCHELFERVGLAPETLERYPHELSGGQRQRVVIARALAVEPEVLICDEPVSALDISIRTQIMNLFMKLQKENGLACLFISHDLSIVRQAAQRIYVMYLGRIVELGSSAELYGRPLHPYSQALLSAIPSPDPRVERNRARVILAGELPDPAKPPSGCRFRTRCPAARAVCAETEPTFGANGVGHAAACHFSGRVDIVEQSAMRLG